MQGVTERERKNDIGEMEVLTFPLVRHEDGAACGAFVGWGFGVWASSFTPGRHICHSLLFSFLPLVNTSTGTSPTHLLLEQTVHKNEDVRETQSTCLSEMVTVSRATLPLFLHAQGHRMNRTVDRTVCCRCVQSSRW